MRRMTEIWVRGYFNNKNTQVSAEMNREDVLCRLKLDKQS